MARGSTHGYDALKAEAFRALEDDDLEGLVRELVLRELTERHAVDFTLTSPDKSVSGPDLRVEIHSVPTMSAGDFQRERAAKPLTYDGVGPSTVYSVKSGKKWREHALRDAKERSQWAVDALADGGRFVLVLSHNKAPPSASQAKSAKKTAKRASAKKHTGPTTAPTRKSDIRRELADAYFARLRAIDPGAVDPFERVHVVDANDLREYMHNTGYTVSRPLREKLGIPRMRGASDLDEWLAIHQNDRRPTPEYVWDDSRTDGKTALIDRLKSTADDPDARAVWLVAPPGVGKTRLVVESLRSERHDVLGEDSPFDARTFVALNADDALDLLREQELLGSYTDAILVVDDCLLDDVARVHSAFVRHKHRGGLVIITPHAVDQRSPQVPPTLARIDLKPMDVASSRDLVAKELGVEATDLRVTQIARLTEGYPWFSVLVAREFAGRPNEPAPRTVIDAVDLALCPRNHLNFVPEVRRRKAALMTVMLAEGEDLHLLSADQKKEFAELFDFAGWATLKETIDACADRGLLRSGEGGIYRYVTPAIVEREIAGWFLNPPPGSGPPLVSRLRSQAMKRRFELLRGRLEHLGISEAILAELAQPIVNALAIGGSDIGAIRSVSSPELLFAARHQPAALAIILRDRVEATSVESLRAQRGLRRPLVTALELIASRRDSFEDAEAALFRLACAENETYANNATGAWAELFDAVANTTYRTVAERLPLLQARARSAQADERVTALAALGRLTAMRGFKLAGDQEDGPYPQPTREEAAEATALAWRLLLERLTDDDARARERASEIVARDLRQAVRSGLFERIAESLIASVGSLHDAALLPMQREIDLAKHYDEVFLRTPEAVEAWRRLRERLAPTSYRDRLRTKVGAWAPASLSNDEEVDATLAREGLEPPHLLLRELDWLESKEAARAAPFVYRAGTVDVHEVLLEPLLSRAGSDAHLLSAYLGGRYEAGAGATVDRVIERLRDGGAFDAAATAVRAAGDSPRRAAWLIDDIATRRVSDQALSMFGLAAWSIGLSDDQMARFIDALLTHGSAAAVKAALLSVERRVYGNDDAMKRWGDVLLRVFERASALDVDEGGQFAYAWQRAAEKLVAHGGVAVVSRCAVDAVLRGRDGIPHDAVSDVVKLCANADGATTWDAIRAGLERGGTASRRLPHVIRSVAAARHLPAHAMMAWVGRNGDRAEIAAEMVSMHDGNELPALARELIVRFGPTSTPADALIRELDTPPRAVGSLAQFARAEAERVRPWQDDPHAAVRRFAARAIEELVSSADQFGAHEEYERRRRTGA